MGTATIIMATITITLTITLMLTMSTIIYRPKNAPIRSDARANISTCAAHGLGSLAALVAAIVIQRGGPAIVDPLASFLVVGILLWGAIRLIRDAIFVLVEAAPHHLPVDEVRHMILDVEGVHGVHDLHVWTLGAGHDAVMTHVVGAVDDRGLADRVRSMLREKTNARYVTVQVDWE